MGLGSFFSKERRQAKRAEKENKISQEEALRLAKAEVERKEAEKRAREEALKAERENAQRAEAERIAREEAEAKAAKEAAARAEQERIAREEAEKKEAKRLAWEEAQRAERERIAREEAAAKAAKEEAERIAREEAERKAKEEEERRAREAELAAKEKEKAERLAREAAEKAEAERRAKEEAARKAEAERKAKEEARLARERAEEEKALKAARENAERIRRAREEADRKAAEQKRAEEEAAAAAKAEAERIAAEEKAAQEQKAQEEAAAAESQKKKGFFARLRQGLTRTRENFSGKVDQLIEASEEIDDDFYDELTDILILADVGVNTSTYVVDELKKQVAAENLTDPKAVKQRLRDILSGMMKDTDLRFPSPTILMVIGVNGVGKTTTIGKLATRFTFIGRKVMLCAGDTFRAAAADQLEIWAQRANVPIVRQHEGADAASVLYDAIQSAKARKMDVLVVDTAGRLHNKAHLMEELRKMARVASREFPEAEFRTLLVIDATTGQNGVEQARVFKDVAKLDGIILTKMDGTAKGGIAIAIRHELGLPVRYIGIGEGIDDLQPFDAKDFIEAIF